MISTTYRWNINNIPSNFLPIYVTRFPPKDNTLIPVLQDLSPSIELFNDYKTNKIEWNEFVLRYNKEVLHDDNDTLNNLISVVKMGQDICLICFEKDNEFCHRRLVAEYIANKTNIRWYEL